MSLLKPTDGELCDRISVVELKYKATKDMKFKTESMDLLITVLAKRKVREASLDEFISLYNELAKHNAILWDLTDRQAKIAMGDARVYEEEPFDILCELFNENQKRHKLIAEINKLTGEYEGEEKVF